MARAYRYRKRWEVRYVVIVAHRRVLRGIATDEQRALDAVIQPRCPGCGVPVWAGLGGRRADAVYCSARCRTRAWRERASRARRRVADHDAEPSRGDSWAS